MHKCIGRSYRYFQTIQFFQNFGAGAGRNRFFLLPPKLNLKLVTYLRSYYIPVGNDELKFTLLLLQTEPRALIEACTKIIKQKSTLQSVFGYNKNNTV